MIEYIQGSVAELTPATVTIDTNGVGYLLNISVNTFTGLQNATSAKLYVHENIREDAWVLYGFATMEERELFRLLIGVSGVGASTARVILSGFTTAELRQVIASGDSRSLKNVKGIGAKTAERIIVDLRDKIKTDDITLPIRTPQTNQVLDEAQAALVMLGYTRQQSQKALQRIFDADPAVSVETAIRKALAMM